MRLRMMGGPKAGETHDSGDQLPEAWLPFSSVKGFDPDGGGMILRYGNYQLVLRRPADSFGPDELAYRWAGWGR